jgi:hypothetical protein
MRVFHICRFPDARNERFGASSTFGAGWLSYPTIMITANRDLHLHGHKNAGLVAADVLPLL